MLRSESSAPLDRTDREEVASKSEHPKRRWTEFKPFKGDSLSRGPTSIHGMILTKQPTLVIDKGFQTTKKTYVSSPLRLEVD